MPRTPKQPKIIATLKHKEAKRTNIPTAEYQSVMQAEDKAPVKVSYPRGAHGMKKEKDERTRALDPQLVWRGKDQQDWSDLVVNAPPLYIQEKVKPKVLIDDLLRETKEHPRGRGAGAGLPSPSGRGAGGEGPGSPDAGNYEQINLFADFNEIGRAHV